jgi:hypothetical protein
MRGVGVLDSSRKVLGTGGDSPNARKRARSAKAGGIHGRSSGCALLKTRRRNEDNNDERPRANKASVRHSEEREAGGGGRAELSGRRVVCVRAEGRGRGLGAALVLLMRASLGTQHLLLSFLDGIGA